MGFHEGLERRSIAVVADLQADVPAATANHPRNRRSIGFPRAMTTGLIGTTARWVGNISVFAAFLAGVLVEFIGLSHVIR